MHYLQKTFVLGALFIYSLPTQAVEYNNLSTEPPSNYMAIGVGFDFGGALEDTSLPAPYNLGFGFGTFHFSATGDYYMPSMFGFTGYAKYGTSAASLTNENPLLDDSFDSPWRLEGGAMYFITDEEASGTASIVLDSQSWGNSQVTYTRTTSLPGTKAHYRTMIAARAGMILDRNTFSYDNPPVNIVNTSFNGTYFGISWIEALAARIEITEGQYRGRYSRSEVEQYYADFIVGSVSQDSTFPGMPELISTGWRVGYKDASPKGGFATTFEIGAKPGLPDNYYLNMEWMYSFSLD